MRCITLPGARCGRRSALVAILKRDVGNAAMLLNAFDLETSSGTRNLELRAGAFVGLGIEADLLAVSSDGQADGTAEDAFLTRLQRAYGLRLESTQRAVDLSGSLVNSWVSTELSLHPVLSGAGGRPVNSHFQRVAVVAGGLGHEQERDQPWSAFNRLFSLLAILPMQGIHCRTVAAPLFGLHPNGPDAAADYPHLLDICKQAFRHLPELHRLILFDRDDQVLRPLGATIDRTIQRKDPHHTLVELPRDLDALESLRHLCRCVLEDDSLKRLRVAADLTELIQLLQSDQVSPISLGLHSRRLLERLVTHCLHQCGDQQQRGLNNGIQQLRSLGLDPWLLSCMHQVRTFGNWMGHPQDTGRSRRVEQHDVLAMLCSLQRILADYPWITPPASPGRESSAYGP
ncbi:DUF4145 domain-containing protein [Synechococcus sp. CS-197]|uniref:DUF4145 domain-containing protein n=1 Tax=Synechococcus sp. CS-197 TaxID=2847985 RepID=UPI00015254EF|nr:DUF4145 domain-containing protein [Synechococcus sp. CS-197]MCT0251801.1 DUF4145 domain-containing protein [Synechococcus sp. CS-197]CAK23371.1 Hypothetical protein SynWH7803_0945 [Synechococcus sp. WH 7803]